VATARRFQDFFHRRKKANAVGEKVDRDFAAASHDEAMQNGVVFVDSREGAMREPGDVILSGAKIYAELGEALAGKVPSRASETTIFKSLGMAVEDIATALLAYRAATATQ